VKLLALAVDGDRSVGCCIRGVWYTKLLALAFPLDGDWLMIEEMYRGLSRDATDVEDGY